MEMKILKSRLVSLCCWKPSLCWPWSISTSELLCISAFSIFPQASCGRRSPRSGPRHAYTLGELPTSEFPFSSWMVYDHLAGELLEFYPSQRFKQPRALEEQSNLTEAEDVSNDCLSSGCFWFDGHGRPPLASWGQNTSVLANPGLKYCRSVLIC